MEITSEYETRVICDGPCHVCKHSREKDLIQAQDIVYYCRACQEKYLCNDVLGRDLESSEYLCPKCNASIAEITVERAQQLGLAYGFHFSKLSPEVRPVDQIRKSWFYTTQREIISKDFVTELINYELLDTPQILDLLFHSDLRFTNPSDWTRDKKGLLWEIFTKKPQIIKSLHNSLITRSEHRKSDLVVRALVNFRNFNCLYMSGIITPSISGTVDLVGIDQKTGGLVWIIVQEQRIDEQIIGTILNEILSIPPLEFMGVERIIILTQKWIWMAAEIARRQGRITTRWHQIQIETWEEDSLFYHKMI